MVTTVKTLARVCLLVSCVTTFLLVPGVATGLRDPNPSLQNRRQAITTLLDAIGEEQKDIGAALDEYAIAQTAETARVMVKKMLGKYRPIRKSWLLRNTVEQLRSAKDGKEGTITPFPTMELISGSNYSQGGGPENLPSVEMFQAQVDQLDEMLAVAKRGTEVLSNGTKIFMIDSAAIRAAETNRAKAVSAMDAIKLVVKLKLDLKGPGGLDLKGGGLKGLTEEKRLALGGLTDAKRLALTNQLKSAVKAASKSVNQVDNAPSSITEFASAAAVLERKLSAATASGDRKWAWNLKLQLTQMQATLKASSSPLSSGDLGFGKMMGFFGSAWGRHEKTAEHRQRSAKLLAEVAQANMEAQAEVSKQVSDDRARALALANEAAELKARLSKAEERIMAIKKKSQETSDGIVLKRAELRKFVKQLEALRSQNQKLQESITMMSTSVESNAQLFDTA